MGRDLSFIDDFIKITYTLEDVRSGKFGDNIHTFKRIEDADVLGRVYTRLSKHFGVKNVSVEGGVIKIFTSEEDQNSFITDILNANLEDVKMIIDWGFKRWMSWDVGYTKRFLAFYDRRN